MYLIHEYYSHIIHVKQYTLALMILWKTETCLLLVHDNVLKCTPYVLNMQVIWNTALQQSQDNQTV
jgi:hypothetical protein